MCITPRPTMRRWFVYTNTSYYPDAEIIEAETPEEARAKFYDLSGPIAVFPLDTLALWTGNEPIEEALKG